MKNELKFYEKSHKYKIGNKELVSVTTFIGQFFEEFDAKEIARKLAKFPRNKALKHGVRYWLADWKARAEYGTLVHKEIEDYINNTIIPKELKSLQGITAFHVLTSRVDDVFAEKRVFNEELGIAGTIDLMIDKEDGITLVDWKSNKKLDNTAYNNKKGIKKPLLDVNDTKINRYTLQLSLYAYMLELDGYKIDKLFIVHLLDDEYRLIEVCYDKELIIKMLKEKDD